MCFVEIVLESSCQRPDLVVYDTDIHTLPLKIHPAMNRLIREFIHASYSIHYLARSCERYGYTVLILAATMSI